MEFVPESTLVDGHDVQFVAMSEQVKQLASHGRHRVGFVPEVKKPLPHMPHVELVVESVEGLMQFVQVLEAPTQARQFGSH